MHRREWGPTADMEYHPSYTHIVYFDRNTSFRPFETPAICLDVIDKNVLIQNNFGKKYIT